MRDLQNIGYELREKDVQATEQPIATRSAAGQIGGDGSAEVADRAASIKASVLLILLVTGHAVRARL